jgi:transposase
MTLWVHLLISGGCLWSPEGGVLKKVEILAPSSRRRVRTEQEKAALLAEIDAEGGKVRLVARRHNISESVLYNWRSARKAAAVAMGAPENVTFIPAGIIEGPISRNPPLLTSTESEPEPKTAGQSLASTAGRTGSIEITLPNGTRH